MLATEQVTELESKPAPKPLLEEHAANEVMRHIPSASWIADKLDGDLRRRIETLCAACGGNPAGDAALTALAHALDRLADVSKHIRSNGHGPNEPVQKLRWSLNHALSCLWLIDAATFGRRAPFHHFEKSKSEIVYGAFLVVIDRLHRLTQAARTIDAGIDEHLWEGLVQFHEPLREQPMA